ncbi:hypothetical protein FH972_025902 [Carpinus fangiana]|uniref:AB hydrolase-1 domain-containing protein n=1 Tax=Carpinus fangiana TaxID=176857 RepID=A0A5N6L2M1_9ROSI|nr:hypothetical protein FH972_025902 [Carpinus fangiana]
MTTLLDNKVCMAFSGDFWPKALAQGLYRVAAEPWIVGEGLGSSFHKGLDTRLDCLPLHHGDPFSVRHTKLYSAVSIRRHGIQKCDSVAHLQLIPTTGIMLQMFHKIFLLAALLAAALGTAVPTKKVHTTSRGYHYTYYTYPGDTSKATLFLLHGWPDSHTLWDSVLPSLQATGHPIIVPDLLGYAGTSKPNDTFAYNSRDVSADLIELVDAENVTSIIPIGHDWGSFAASRMQLWYPKRVLGVTLLSVAYNPPETTQRFSLAATQQQQQDQFGSPLYAYWSFFTSAEAAPLVERRLDSFYTILHGYAENWGVRTFTTFGGYPSILNDNLRAPLKPYASAVKESILAPLRAGGLSAPFQWYRVFVANYHNDVEKAVPRANYVFDKPVLFVTGSSDTVCRTQLIDPAVEAGLLPRLTRKELTSGHWLPLEVPKQLSAVIVDFLKKNAREFTVRG